MNTFINVSCANMFQKENFRSETVSQAVLWEKINIVEENDRFVRVKTEDSCQGWINKYQIAESELERTEDWIRITADETFIYSETDVSSPVIRDIVGGTTVPQIEKHKGWIKVATPDGNLGWIHDKAIKAFPILSRENLVEYASKFTGRPYLWGGKTPKGFDCSGYAQYVFKMFGIKLRRNAWMQFEDGRFVSDDPFKGQLGDLMFFAEYGGDAITHVGFCLGEGKILHAQGMIRHNSLRKRNPLYHEILLKDFVGIRSFL